MFTDDLQSYDGMPNRHQVRHSVGEYVNDKVHVNGMESFWSMLKRGYYGTCHRMSRAPHPTLRKRVFRPAQPAAMRHRTAISS